MGHVHSSTYIEITALTFSMLAGGKNVLALVGL